MNVSHLGLAQTNRKQTNSRQTPVCSPACLNGGTCAASTANPLVNVSEIELVFLKCSINQEKFRFVIVLPSGAEEHVVEEMCVQYHAKITVFALDQVLIQQV